MKPYLIQPVGKTEYAQLDKPVNYTPSFLTGLTNQKKIPVREEHSGKIITEILGLFYQDGGLYATFKDDVDVRNRGISPIFEDVMVNEHDTNIELLKAKIQSVDIVKNPRHLDTFLYNSATVVTDNKPLGDDYLENNALNQEIGSLKIEVNNAKKGEEKSRQALLTKTNEYDELKTKYDELKVKYKTFEDKEADTVETLAVKLTDGDKDLEAVFKTMTLEQLTVLEAKRQSEISDEIKAKAKDLSGDNEEYGKVLEQLDLEQLNVIEKSNGEWDKLLSEKYGNDTGIKGAGAGQTAGYNADGAGEADDKSFKTREEYNKVVGNVVNTKRPVFNL